MIVSAHNHISLSHAGAMLVTGRGTINPQPIDLQTSV